MPKSHVGPPRGRPRGIRRDRDCRTCKSRGTKCDLNRPKCQPCVQAGLNCEGYLQRVVWMRERPKGCEKEVVRVGKKVECDGKLPAPKNVPKSNAPGLASSRHNVRIVDVEGYWLVQRFSEFCQSIDATMDPSVTNDENNVTETSCGGGPRLVSSVYDLLQARMNCSAANSSASTRRPAEFMSRSSCDVAKHVKIALYKLKALTNLNEAICTADPVAFLGIAVFAYFEVVSDKEFGQWQLHLHGARSLLDYHCHNRGELDALANRVAGLTEMIAFLTWWDVIGTLIRQLTGSTNESLIFLDWHRNTMRLDFFETVGCSPETFQLLVTLCKTTAEEEEDADEARERYIRAMIQLLELGADPTAKGQCCDMWRCAAVIAILRMTDGEDHQTQSSSAFKPRRMAAELAIGRICQNISSASPSSRYYTHMATPAFLASYEATTVEKCQVLRSYWRNCQAGQFPRYAGASAQCEAIWKAKGVFE